MQLTAIVSSVMPELFRRTKRGVNKKLLLAMKFTAFLLLAACMAASASGLSQTVTLKMNNVPVQKVFRELIKQTGVSIVYKEALFKDVQPVNIDVKNATVQQVLQTCLQNSSLQYSVEGNTIVIQEVKQPTANPPAGPPVPVEIRVRVTDSTGHPLPGATVTVKNSKVSGVTDAEGMFTLNAAEGDVLLVSYVGYETRSVIVTPSMLSSTNNLVITLRPSVTKLEDVEVTVNTGYQTLSPERTTGSYNSIDRKLLNRKISTNILERLDGIAVGVLFDKSNVGAGNPDGINVRGRSTIFASKDPLIILDNFPYEGNFSSINPNDIESISVLKDAAATSIWGARAGNGVIVITTKKGRNNAPLQVNVNSNVTIGQKPDLFYSRQMSISDFIDVEKFLFEKGAFDGNLQFSPNAAVSPVIDILDRQRRGLLTPAEATGMIDQLRSQDVRRDLQEYIYRNLINQQYALNITGGSERNQFYLSAGYDRNTSSIRNNSYKRISINANNSYSIIKDKLELSAGIMLSKSNTNSAPVNVSVGDNPYAKLVDANGSRLAVGGTVRQSFATSPANALLQDWSLRPLDELENADNKNELLEYRLNTNLKYTIIPGLDLNILYQYNRGLDETTNYYSLNTFVARDLINTFSQINNNTVTYIVPYGGVLDYKKNSYVTNNVRGQLNWVKQFDKHFVTALGGIERRSVVTGLIPNTRLYGYDKELQSYQLVDFLTYYPQLQTGFTALIPQNYLGNVRKITTDNNFSYYANGAYTYGNRYIFSLSARTDKSNLFGVNTNQKGVPLWSTGFAWKISNESFYHTGWLQDLKFRATFGYSGNVDKTASSFVTSSVLPDNNPYNAPRQSLRNPPNGNLQWEKISMANLAIDFNAFNGALSGSFDYYKKRGTDLIGFSPLAPSAGITSFKGNVANIKGQGIDLILNSKNIDNQVKWTTTFLFSYNSDKITKYNVQPGNPALYISQPGLNPFVGRSTTALFAYEWGGLDPANGDPIGVLNGVSSKNYSSIISDVNALKYMGSAVPKIFGGIRNTFSYKSFELSFNVSYKFDYVFRRISLDYSNLYSTFLSATANPDYAKRWQKPGDELVTDIPSAQYPNNNTRSTFYTNSEVLVEKGDHIRLQDIQFSYDVRGVKIKGVSTMRINAYVNNLGIIWKANRYGIDPDVAFFSSYPNPKTFAVGINLIF